MANAYVCPICGAPVIYQMWGMCVLNFDVNSNFEGVLNNFDMSNAEGDDFFCSADASHDLGDDIWEAMDMSGIWILSTDPCGKGD